MSCNVRGEVRFTFTDVSTMRSAPFRSVPFLFPAARHPFPAGAQSAAFTATRSAQRSTVQYRTVPHSTAQYQDITGDHIALHYVTLHSTGIRSAASPSRSLRRACATSPTPRLAPRSEVCGNINIRRMSCETGVRDKPDALKGVRFRMLNLNRSSARSFDSFDSIRFVRKRFCVRCPRYSGLPSVRRRREIEHHITLHCIVLYRIASHCIALHSTGRAGQAHHIASHHMTLYHITSHRIALHCIPQVELGKLDSSHIYVMDDDEWPGNTQPDDDDHLAGINLATAPAAGAFATEVPQWELM